MEQLTLDNMAEGQLGDGANIKPGDLVKWTLSFYTGFTRVVMHEGVLCLEETFMHGRNIPIHILIADHFTRVYKITLAEMYKFCKENQWDTADYMVRFGRKEKA